MSEKKSKDRTLFDDIVDRRSSISISDRSLRSGKGMGEGMGLFSSSCSFFRTPIIKEFTQSESVKISPFDTIQSTMLPSLFSNLP